MIFRDFRVVEFSRKEIQDFPGGVGTLTISRRGRRGSVLTGIRGSRRRCRVSGVRRHAVKDPADGHELTSVLTTYWRSLHRAVQLRTPPGGPRSHRAPAAVRHRITSAMLTRPQHSNNKNNNNADNF